MNNNKMLTSQKSFKIQEVSNKLKDNNDQNDEKVFLKSI